MRSFIWNKQKNVLVCLLFNFEYKLLCFYFCSYFTSHFPTRCHSSYAQIQSMASGRVNGARALLNRNKAAVNDLSRNDADRQSKFIFRIHCNHSKIDDNNSHTCIRSCTSLRAFCFTVPMCSFRKLSEGGTFFETATLSGLIADEWQFNNIQLSMRLVFLPVLTGGLAYRGCYGYGGPPQSPRPPRRSPALPIATHMN